MLFFEQITIRSSSQQSAIGWFQNLMRIIRKGVLFQRNALIGVQQHIGYIELLVLGVRQPDAKTIPRSAYLLLYRQRGFTQQTRYARTDLRTNSFQCMHTEKHGHKRTNTFTSKRHLDSGQSDKQSEKTPGQWPIRQTERKDTWTVANQKDRARRHLDSGQSDRQSEKQIDSAN